MIYWLFAATSFLGAILVFSLQPMAGKMLLPTMGGTPAVWNTAMVFFQVMLLAGYLYVHGSIRWLGARRQALVHLIVAVIAIGFLPIAIGEPNGALEHLPAAWVLSALFVAVGLPFLVVSATAPLLQRWLSATDHPDARDPYHLYAASNVGSVAALLTYPFLLEPWFGLSAQARLWAGAYGALVVALAVCGIWTLRRSCGAGDKWSVTRIESPDWRLRGRWFVWAFIPSSLLLSVTTVLTTDLAPMPVLWVVPLALYLLTHVHAFARRRPLSTTTLAWCVPPFAIPVLAILAFGVVEPILPVLMLHLGLLAAIALLFHGLLADHRPAPVYLTSFYVWLALGGAAGGTFNALLAPVVFDRVLEYPLVLLLAAVALPGAFWRLRTVRRSVLLVLAGTLFVAVAALLFALDTLGVAGRTALIAVGCGVVALAVRWFRSAAVARGTAIVGVLAAVAAIGMGEPGELVAQRSFYGTHRVLVDEDGAYHQLMHGNISHGVQARAEDVRQVPLSYYHPSGPLGDVFNGLTAARPHGDIAVVGLGGGAIASYRRPYQRMVFYEIDPVVGAIAANSDLFTYLTDCGRGCRVTFGDGRLNLAREPEGRFSLIVLDAYSSAAIPVHLLTREAFETFLGALANEGMIAVHVSNRYLELAPIVAAIGNDLGLAVRRRTHWQEGGIGLKDWIASSDWVVLSRAKESVVALDAHGWGAIVPAPGRVWTDDYAPVWLAYLKRP